MPTKKGGYPGQHNISGSLGYSTLGLPKTRGKTAAPTIGTSSATTGTNLVGTYNFKGQIRKPPPTTLKAIFLGNYLEPPAKGTQPTPAPQPGLFARLFKRNNAVAPDPAAAKTGGGKAKKRKPVTSPAPKQNVPKQNIRKNKK